MFRSIVKNHAPVDGNKRLGLTSMAVFLFQNGYVFRMEPNDAVELAVWVAERSPNVREIASFLRRGSVSFEKLDRMSPGDRRAILPAWAVAYLSLR